MWQGLGWHQREVRQQYVAGRYWAQHNKTRAQVAIAWILDRDEVGLVFGSGRADFVGRGVRGEEAA